MFRATSSACSPVGSYSLSGKSLRALADVCNVRALGAPPNPSSHLSQATRGLHGAVSYSEAVGRSFPPDGPIDQQPSSPSGQDLTARLGRWRFDLLTLPNQPRAQCFHGTFEDLFFLWVRGPWTPSTFLRRVRNRGRRVSLQGPSARD